jgi:hypothetical protein
VGGGLLPPRLPWLGQRSSPHHRCPNARAGRATRDGGAASDSRTTPRARTVQAVRQAPPSSAWRSWEVVLHRSCWLIRAASERYEDKGCLWRAFLLSHDLCSTTRSSILGVWEQRNRDGKLSITVPLLPRTLCHLFFRLGNEPFAPGTRSGKNSQRVHASQRMPSQSMVSYSLQSRKGGLTCLVSWTLTSRDTVRCLEPRHPGAERPTRVSTMAFMFQAWGFFQGTRNPAT